MADEIIDEAELLRQLEGDEELLRELIETFLAECDGLLSDVLRAVADRDAAGLERAAHKLKGTVSIFGSREATSLAQALETMGRAGDLRGAKGAVARLQERMKALGRALAAMRERHV